MTIGIGIYVKRSTEAVELYKKAFGLELGYHVLNADGSYFHSELYRDGHEMLSVVESGAESAEIPNRITQIGVTLDSEEEVRSAFELLSDGGTVEMPISVLAWSPCAGCVTDKFGVYWYITAQQHRPDDSWTPDTP